MKVLLAFDSFKNCLSGGEICRIAAESIRENAPECEIIPLPLGDGGEGTARAVAELCGGTEQTFPVRGPLFEMTSARWYQLPGNRAVFEMASASGIELIAREQRDPLTATTFGTGELLKHVAGQGVREIVIGIGGSATVDGGIGMLQALGVEFYDENDRPLPVPAAAADIARIARIGLDRIPECLRNCRIIVASDVVNPLCGRSGAAAVFAPQKGADAAGVELLEKNLFRFGTLAVEQGIADNFSTPGDGAAGGLGFALRTFLKADVSSGAELILELSEFDRKIRGADFVLTGEGCSDSQTADGKLCGVIAAHCRRAGVPVILLPGALGSDPDMLDGAFDAVFPLCHAPVSLDEAVACTPQNLKRTIRSIVKLWMCKMEKR